MEASEDWCFFIKVAEKIVGISSEDNHSNQLLSVNNRFG